MPTFPSRRALFAFARVISASKGNYRCPRCIRILQNDGRRPSTRRFGLSAIQKSNYDEYGGHSIDFQPSGRKDDDQIIPTSSLEVNDVPSKVGQRPPLSGFALNAELEQIAKGLEMTVLGIEELEDALMGTVSPQFAEGKGLEQDFPEWYLRPDTQGESQDSMENFGTWERKDIQAEYDQSDALSDSSQQASTTMLPWYLRDQESETSILPRIDIQQTQLERYPDLPVNSPPLLQPLVSRLFYDHHLQNIVLLDLRNRDPPPVWGSNTIMILATVRSERQLAGVAEAVVDWPVDWIIEDSIHDFLEGTGQAIISMISEVRTLGFVDSIRP